MKYLKRNPQTTCVDLIELLHTLDKKIAETFSSTSSAIHTKPSPTSSGRNSAASSSVQSASISSNDLLSTIRPTIESQVDVNKTSSSSGNE